MKIVKKAFSKDGAGTVVLLPQDIEDMWHVYNLVRPGDRLKAVTYRKVQVGSNADASERVRLHLEVVIEAVDYDGDGGEVRCKGRNQTESEHIKLEAYHTITLQPQSEFRLTKERWDALDVARVQEAADPTATADLAVVLLSDGIAHVCLVGRSSTVMRAKVEVKLPKKRGAGAQAGFNDAWARYMRQCYDAVLTHVDWTVVQCLVIAGPGFAKDSFREHLMVEAGRTGNKAMLQNKDRLVVTHASSPYLQALEEIFAQKDVAHRIADTKAAQEMAALDDFYGMLTRDPERAFYGPGHVLAAAEQGAIATLLLSDSLYRVHDVKLRRRWVDLTESVQAVGGKVFIFSARHSSGQQLEQLTGVAAVLRFPMPHLEDEDPADLLARMTL